MVTAKRSAGVIAAALMLTGGSSTAHARLITFQFAGIIDSVVDPDNVLEDAVLPGNPFSGSYTFESTTPDARADDPELGHYGPPGPAVLFSINSLDIVVADDNSRIGVANNPFSSNPLDYYYVTARFPFSAGDLTILEIGLRFEDDEGLVLSNDSLPLLPPDLSAFEKRQFNVQGKKDGAMHFFIVGTVTTLTPEPGTVAILSSGLVLMTARRGSHVMGSCVS